MDTLAYLRQDALTIINYSDCDGRNNTSVTGRIIALAALQGRVHSPLCTRMLLLSRALAGARAVS